ncbi:MAG: hypothetical protein KDC66_18540 [Phaeodactylibacter sp.]|nr:hypothetical protein [Phaeodactylibacter sp.]MCB9276540.1 histidinol phosphatase [Lewinellaceae bacterium]
MFNLFKKTARLKDYSFLGVDLHSHLLPGIDDGAKSVTDSLALIGEMQQMGFRKLITTPHVMSDLYPNTPETILKQYQLVSDALAGEPGITAALHTAAEYLLDEQFGQKMAHGELLTLPGRRVLVEMSFISAPPQLDEYLFRLQAKGYRPLLAHPERYLFLRESFRRYFDLKERGCEFQLNILSLTGYYGKHVRENAFLLLREGLIDFLGTDLHHRQHAENLRLALEDPAIAKALRKMEFKNSELG